MRWFSLLPFNLNWQTVWEMVNCPTSSARFNKMDYNCIKLRALSNRICRNFTFRSYLTCDQAFFRWLGQKVKNRTPDTFTSWVICRPFLSYASINVKPEGGTPGICGAFDFSEECFGQNPHCVAPRFGQIRSNIPIKKMSSEKQSFYINIKTTAYLY